MATRAIVIERILRQIYGGNPTDDSNITYNLVNQWLNDGIGIAAKKNYTDNIQLDGVSYVNNSFYTSFSDVPVNQIDPTTYQIDLPQIPTAIGKNEGISALQFVDSKGLVSHTAIPLTANQIAYIPESLRIIQNKLLYWNEGKNIFIKSNIILSKYKTKIRMVSGGDSNDLNSTLNIPDDYMPTVIEYVRNQLLIEQQRPIDVDNDGVDSRG
jgi:hypothetical protein